MTFRSYPDVIHWNGNVNISVIDVGKSYVIISTGVTKFTLTASSVELLLELLDAVSNRQTSCRADEYINASASYAAKCIRRSMILKREGKLNKKIFIRDFLTSNKK